MKPPTNYSPNSFHYYGVPYSTDEIELDCLARAEMWDRYDDMMQERAYRHRYECLRVMGFVIGLLLGIGFVMLISL